MKSITNWSKMLWIGVIILTLLFFNVLIIIKLQVVQKFNSELQSSLFKEQIANKKKNDLIIKNMQLQSKLNGSLKEKISKPLQTQYNEVLLIFSDRDCKQCVFSLIMDLNILAKKIGSKNIVLVGDFKNKTDLDSYLYEINDQFSSVLFKDMFRCEIDKIDKPILLIKDAFDNIRCVFYDPDSDTNLKKMYLDEFADNLVIW